ncbi:MAG: aminotransferase class I/II-fold pyridoxal phosphate-dependent enzyme [Candidatus Poseidoniia archaeon]|nr:aminotransferase class I/II-fold pyridoxal phosphate-dependent enzyme [Candidatus Poseidoniia archaeon]
MTTPTDWMKKEYNDLVKKGFDWKPPVITGASAARCIINGTEKIMLCANNYLNLSTHPKVKQAAKNAVDTHGAGSGSVRPIAGNMDIHNQLEETIARFKNREAALYYQTGFAVNSGLIPQLAGKKDAIISDQLNHGSIIDGIRLSRVRNENRTIYPHNDMGGLEYQLRTMTKQCEKTLVISDGVFSMDGDIAPLHEITKLAREYGAMTYIDDCHGEGVLAGGRGIGSHFGVEDEVDMESGSFSKAFGVVGGLVAGEKHMVDYAFNKSRTMLLSGSAPPATIAACMASIEVLESEPQHVENLWSNTNYFRKEIQSLGFDTGVSETPIIPVMCGESHSAKALSAELLNHDVFALPIVFPMVARDKSRIRVMISAGLSKEDLDIALNGFEKGGKSAGII